MAFRVTTWPCHCSAYDAGAQTSSSSCTSKLPWYETEESRRKRKKRKEEEEKKKKKKSDKGRIRRRVQNFRQQKGPDTALKIHLCDPGKAQNPVFMYPLLPYRPLLSTLFRNEHKKLERKHIENGPKRALFCRFFHHKGQKF